VESVTLTATTGTAGNFGITLFRRLFEFSIYHGMGTNGDALIELGAQADDLPTDPCLFWIAISDSLTSPFTVQVDYFDS
jgi:hypothetical protein